MFGQCREPSSSARSWRSRGPVPANFLRCWAGPGERWVWCLSGGAESGMVAASGRWWCG